MSYAITGGTTNANHEVQLNFDEPVEFTNSSSSFLNAVSATGLNLTNATASINNDTVTITLDSSYAFNDNYSASDLAVTPGELQDTSGNDFSISGATIADGWVTTVTNVSYTDTSASSGTDASDIQIAFDDIGGAGVDETNTPYDTDNYYVGIFTDGTSYQTAISQMVNDINSMIFDAGTATGTIDALNQIVANNQLYEIPATSGDDGALAGLPSTITTYGESAITADGNYQAFVFVVDQDHNVISISEDNVNVSVGD